MKEFIGVNQDVEKMSHENLEMELHSILTGNDVLIACDEKLPSMPAAEESKTKINFMELMSQALDFVKEQPEYERSRTSFGLDHNELMIDFNGDGEFDKVIQVTEFYKMRTNN